MRYTQKKYDMKFVAGFFGVAQDSKVEHAVRPSIGWATFYWKEKPLLETN